MLGAGLVLGTGCSKSRKLAKQEPGLNPDTLVGKQATVPTDTLVRKCPQAWYIDAMPWVGDAKARPPREYLIIDEQRVELSQADTVWIKANCTVQKSVLH